MNERSTLIQPSTIRFERLLPGPIERVWAYLVESDKRAQWLAAGDFDLRVGGTIELIFNNDNLSEDKHPDGPKATGGKGRFTGVITRLEPPRVLAHTWSWDGRDSDVLYELAPRGKEVLLTIHHRLPADAQLTRGVGGGWPVHTGILADVLSGVKPRPFWKSHAAALKEFLAAYG